MEYIDEVRNLFRYYCYHVHNVGRKENELMWYPTKFHKFLCDEAQKFLEEKTANPYDILIISCPPQHGKSKTISETLPSWFLMRNPDKKVILVSYGDDLARRFGKANLDKVKSFGEIFGVTIDKGKANAKEFRLAKREGVMISAGYGAGLTGNRADLIVIDDPVKNRVEADSEKDREKKWNDYVDSIETRMAAGGKLILIMTRWHEDDLAGRLMEKRADSVKVINLPCEAEEDDLLGRKPGDALCPEIGKDKKWLKALKKNHTDEQGLRSWNALYQGRPTALEGNMLKRDWWEYYEYKDYEDGKIPLQSVIIAVDAAFKDEKKNDYVAIGVWGKHNNRYYMLDMINEHLNFTQTIRKIQVMNARFPETSAILIEDRANGPAIIEMLKNQVARVIAFSPGATKEERVNAISTLIEAGNVYLPKDKKITWAFIDQCASFPNGKHDDMVDVCSMALIRLNRVRGFARFARKAKARMDNEFNVPRIRTRSGGEKGAIIDVI